MRERVFGHMRQRRLRSAYASAQSDQSRHCPLTKQLEQRPGCYFAYAQDDLNQRILRIFEGTSTLDEAHISLRKHAYSKIYWNFTTKTRTIFRWKILTFFHISAQIIDCVYSLEPPRRGGSNEYHNLCFWAEIRKIMYTPVLLYKSGVSGGQNYIGVCSWCST